MSESLEARVNGVFMNLMMARESHVRFNAQIENPAEEVIKQTSIGDEASRNHHLSTFLKRREAGSLKANGRIRNLREELRTVLGSDRQAVLMAHHLFAEHIGKIRQDLSKAAEETRGELEMQLAAAEDEFRRAFERITPSSAS